MTKPEIDPEEFPSEKASAKKAAASDPKKVASNKDQDTQATEKPTADEVVDKLLDANQKLEKDLKVSQDQELRLQAEIQNIKKHNQQEQASLIRYDGQKLATAILPSIDNLERALQASSADQTNDGLITGVQMVLKHLKQALAENDITEIKALNEKFDPTIHQAVQTVASDDEHPADTVVQVLQAGYQLKDRVLRPSMVVVAQ